MIKFALNMLLFKLSKGKIQTVVQKKKSYANAFT